MKTKKKIRSGIVIAMFARYGKTTTTMKDRRMRRNKDFSKSWKREEY